MSPVSKWYYDDVTDNWRCANCRMVADNPDVICHFCGCTMTNYEEIEVEDFLNRELDKRYEER